MNVELQPPKSGSKTSAELALAQEFAAARATLPGDARIKALRDAEFARFDAKGLPHRRIEEWKYTDLRALMRDAKPLAVAPSTASQDRALARATNAGKLLADMDARRLVFVDGMFVAGLSDLTGLERGLTVRSMAQALSAGDPLIASHLGTFAPPEGNGTLALNTALMTDGALIHVQAGATVERPIHLVFASTGERPASVFTRSLIVIEQGARVMLV